MSPLILSPFDTATNSNSNTPTNTVNSNAGGAVDPNAGNNDNVSSNSFLQLLVTQLQNQDPTQPVDDSQWLSELANFSSLQQMTDMNTTLTNQSGLTQISSISSLIGKTATTNQLDASGNPITGVVSGASVANGTVTLTIGSNQVPLSSVTGLSQTPASSTSTTTS